MRVGSRGAECAPLTCPACGSAASRVQIARHRRWPCKSCGARLAFRTTWSAATTLLVVALATLAPWALGLRGPWLALGFAALLMPAAVGVGGVALSLWPPRLNVAGPPARRAPRPARAFGRLADDHRSRSGSPGPRRRLAVLQAEKTIASLGGTRQTARRQGSRPPCPWAQRAGGVVSSQEAGPKPRGIFTAPVSAPLA